MPLFPEDVAAWSVGRLEGLVREARTLPPRSFEEHLLADPRQGARRLGERVAGLRRDRRRENARWRRFTQLERDWSKRVEGPVAGVDEAGMGPLAGPIVAAAAMLPPELRLLPLDDSKKLKPEEREELAGQLREKSDWAIGLAEVDEIAMLNPHHAGLLAMRRAVEGLSREPAALLVDARTVPEVAMPQEGLIKGDAKCACIAAASVLAKVHRDGLMEELGRRHPGYGFEKHRGYGTAEHLEALARLGPSPIHRVGYLPVAEAGGGTSALRELRAALSAAKDLGALEKVAGTDNAHKILRLAIHGNPRFEATLCNRIK
ncbi:MAG: ribonuclease HII, partial [Acidobacteriota bacterium]